MRYLLHMRINLSCLRDSESTQNLDGHSAPTDFVTKEEIFDLSNLQMCHCY